MSSKIGIFLILFTILVSNFIVVPAIAQNDYTVLAPLPGTTIQDNCVAGDKNKECKTNLEKYLPGLFKLAVGLSAAFAVFMIVIGGFQYMSTDALQGKEEGKARIWNSVKGLVLVIGAWLILYTINPGLLELRLSIETIEIKGPPSVSGGGVLGAGGTTPGRAMTPEQVIASNAVREALESVGIYTYTGPCTKGQTTGCVNLDGLTPTTISGLGALSSMVAEAGAGTYLTITGGTEGGHAAAGDHPKGNAIDFGQGNNTNNYQAFSNWIVSRGGTPVETSLGPQYTIQINGKPVTFLKESNPPHWHVTFK